MNRPAGPDLLSPPRPPAAAPARVAPDLDALALAAFALGVLGLALIDVIPFVLALPAVAVGAMARRRISRDPARSGRPLATAGVIMGLIGVALPTLAVVTM